MLLKLYTRFNVLSLDVALGSLCAALFFGKLLHVQILVFGLLSLSVSVWIIYTVDHLLDAKRIKAPASTERHRFHQQHFQVLCWMVVLSIILNIVVVMFIRPAVLRGGLILIACCALYLIVHRVIKFPKEFLIAILYTAGVLLPSLSVTQMELSQLPLVIVVQFLLTAFLNLVIFSWYDRDRDQRDGSASIVLRLGDKKSRKIIFIIPIVNLLLMMWTTDVIASLTVMVMSATLLAVFLCQSFLREDDRFRLLGDAVFFLPLLYLLIS
ncbi:UbiA prenyltransferase family protein [Pseudochryseolinea flava]|uniref:Prenyltransferase n=1 Tax=Pseudochryseolinea flava TaxID=2059302 RepID=A0A364YAD4_9BACT|nr:hypothetical protein [Pseudochryseolinea flava]RAW03355.1 hypothetical protein DQQ10_04525 [Pseudochryseolinea flava]